MHYSIELKKAKIQKYLNRGNGTVADLLKEIGIACFSELKIKKKSPLKPRVFLNNRAF